MDQWLSELARWAEHGAFSYMPYTGKFRENVRKAFWEHWDGLDSPMHRRIIVTTLAVSCCTYSLVAY